ncbi:MAG: ribosomal-protein-alanine N-acetyltransferase [Acidimicrobiia bacterium]|nr:ribosomal-protein-alanine N-acetyltransferase [Acidimicrobiia bacterium]
MKTVKGVEIRPFVVGDIERVHEIETAVYPTPWSTRVFQDELSAPGRTYLVGESDGRVIGFGGLMVISDEAHITTVAVDPDARGAGVGKCLMLRLAEAAIDMGGSSLTLEVRVSNEAARRLYGRFGMAPVGLRKRYYGDEDALIMWVHDIDGEDYRERLDELWGEL